MNELVEALKQNPILLVVVAVLPFLLMALFNTGKAPQKEDPAQKRVNTKVKLDNPKVVDSVKCAEMEDLAQYKDGKVVMCRCWKSETFPFCDGSHVKHNKEAGDNVGPLIVHK